MEPLYYSWAALVEATSPLHVCRKPRIAGRRVLLDQLLRIREHPTGAAVAVEIVQQRRALRFGEAVGEVFNARLALRSGRVPVPVVIHLVVPARDEAGLLQAPHIQMARLVDHRVTAKAGRTREAARDAARVNRVRDVACLRHAVDIRHAPVATSLAGLVAPALVLRVALNHKVAFHRFDNGLRPGFQLRVGSALALSECRRSEEEHGQHSEKARRHGEIFLLRENELKL